MEKIVATSSYEPERIQMKFDLEPGQADAVGALVQAYLDGEVRVCTPSVALRGDSYVEAVATVNTDERTSYFLRQRLSEDGSRDPVDALADAELQLALQTRRFSEEVSDADAAWPRLCVVSRGTAALERLTQSIRTSQIREALAIGQFLLAAHNGDRYRLNLDALDEMQAEMHEDCMLGASDARRGSAAPRRACLGEFVDDSWLGDELLH